MIQLQTQNVGKRYGKRVLFRGMSESFEGGSVTAVTGVNGSGKSTLVRILAGVLTPGKGQVALRISDRAITREQHPFHIGLVAPYLNVYEDFSPEENLLFLARARGYDKPGDRIASVLERVGLPDRGKDLVKTFSSGMKQRVRIASALFFNPPVLLLDEPGSNLDESGHSLVRSIIEESAEDGRIVVLATNDDREVALCTREVRIGDFA